MRSNSLYSGEKRKISYNSYEDFNEVYKLT